MTDEQFRALMDERIIARRLTSSDEYFELGGRVEYVHGRMVFEETGIECFVGVKEFSESIRALKDNPSKYWKTVHLEKALMDERIIARRLTPDEYNEWGLGRDEYIGFRMVDKETAIEFFVGVKEFPESIKALQENPEEHWKSIYGETSD
jgi:hypothetical protein